MRPLFTRLASACLVLVLAPLVYGEPPERQDALGDPLPDGALMRLGTARFWSGPIPGTVRLSPNGKIIALGDPGDAIRLLDAADGSEIRRMKLDQPGPTVLAFTPAADVLAASSFNGSVGLWDTATGKRLGRIDGEGNPVQALVFSADGKTLIVARQNLKQKGVFLAYSVPDCREIRT